MATDNPGAADGRNDGSFSLGDVPVNGGGRA